MLKILKKMKVVYLIFEKNFKDVLLSFVYLTWIRSLLFKMFILEVCFVINSIPIILRLISVISNFCLKGFSKSLFCSLVRVGISYN